MKVGKLNVISSAVGVSSNQAISLEEVITKTIEISLSKNPNLLIEQVQQYTPEAIKELSSQLISQINSVSSYNQISDERIYIGSNENFEVEKAEALRQNNRNRIKMLDKDLQDVKNKLDDQLKDIEYYLDYDEEDSGQVAIMNYLFGVNHTSGKVSFEQILEIRRIINRINSIEGEIRLNRYRKKVKEPLKDLDTEFQSEIDLTYNYLPSKISTLTGLPAELVETVIRNESLAIFGLGDDFLFFLKKNIREYKILGLKNIKDLGIKIKVPNKAKTIKTFDLYADLVNIENEIKDNEGTLKQSNISEKIGLIPLEEETRKLQGALGQAKLIADAQDEKRKQNEEVLDGKKTVKVSGPKDKYQEFTLSGIDSCFDCFKGKWDIQGKFAKDFKFNIGLEKDLSDLLDTIDFNLGEIKSATNLPYIIQQNYCSLMRIGSLCPVELSVIIGSLTSMIIFTWQELMNTRIDFLSDLAINLILKPILNGLKIGINFSFNPLTDYSDCVMSSIEKLMDIDYTGEQYGFKSSVLFNALFIKPNPGFDTGSNLGQVAERVRRTLSQGDISEATLGLVSASSPDNSDKYHNIVTNPLFEFGVIDVLELPKAIVSDAVGKMNNISETINLFIKNIDNMIKSSAQGRIETSKRVLGLTALIPLLSGLWELSTKGIEPCIPMPLSDGNDPGVTKKTLESPFTTKELEKMVQLNNIKYDEIPLSEAEKSIRINSRNPGLESKAYIYNPITDTRFNLTNCDKAKSSIISKGESLEFWKRIALGANLDNV